MSNENQNTANQQLDETVPGGAYVKDGIVVDGEGKPRAGWSVDADGNAVGPTPKGKKGQDAATIDPNASTNSAASTGNEKLGG